MARAATKEDLMTASNENFAKLLTLIQEIPESRRNEAFNFDVSKEKGAHWQRDKNMRDVLIHLYEWHQLLINWVKANQQGIKQQFLLEGYNWRNYGEMNEAFWKKHQGTSFDESLQLLINSHKEVMELVVNFSNEELFSKGAFDWVGNSTLGSYFVSATASHYDWALKKLRKYKKAIKE